MQGKHKKIQKTEIIFGFVYWGRLNEEINTKALRMELSNSQIHLMQLGSKNKAVGV